jgi:uncharacterized membrane protein
MSADTTLPHECVSGPAAELRPPRQLGSHRLDGVDAARGVAMLAMIVLHVLPSVAADGTMSLAWSLSVWNAAALFALVAGVAVALANGRTRHLRGPAWAGAAAGMIVRAVVIGGLGLALGAVVPVDRAAVILPFYAVLFLLAIPLLRLPARWLAPLAVVLAVTVPLLSYAVRSGLPEATVAGTGLANPTLTDLRDAPVGLTVALLLTGAYPALTYLVYLCAGMAIGRLRLDRRRVVATLILAGATIAAAASAASWFLLERLGGEVALRAVALGSMSLSEYGDLRTWGADGSVPTTSRWWLAVLVPHAGTPTALLFMIGVGMAILGAMLLLHRVAPTLLRLLVVFGSMTLSLYVAHLLLLSAPFITVRDGTEFGLHVGLLLAAAWVWRRWSARGPLERVLAWSVRGTRTAVEGRFAVPHRADVRPRENAPDAA